VQFPPFLNMNNYFCFDCLNDFRSEQEPYLTITNEYGEFPGIDCPICEGQAKKVGIVSKFNVSTGISDKSRSKDLEILSDYAGKGMNNAGRLLNEVYKKAKDENLTNMRKELIDAHKFSNVAKTEAIESKIKTYEKAKYGK